MVQNGMAEDSSALIIHNVLWSHYKATVFRELSTLAADRGIRLWIAHISETEGKRGAIDDRTRALHDYPHEVLLPGSRESHGVLKILVRTVALIWRMRPMIIVVPGYADPASWVALVAGKLCGARIIVAVDSTREDKKRFVLWEFVKKVFVSSCDMAFVYGSRAGDYCATLGMPRDRIIVRCQATDNSFVAEEVSRYRSAGEGARVKAGIPWKRTVLLLGRIAAEKNFAVVIRAFQRVMQKDPVLAEEWGVLVVGHGPQREALSTYARDSGVPLFFAGGVPWWDVPRLLALAEIMVLPSLSEPWGLVVNEAMAGGVVAVVSERCGCAPDLIVDGKTGFVFEPSDDERLASILELLMREPELRERVKGAAHTVIGNYSPRAAAEQMASGFQRVLELESGSPSTNTRR
ncbi:MAG: glycosyltransferase family 4 protein [Betaproteobacteria bacterium]|nr:glycosyltransferase family 4 protein [Betaproteobacteria bacterium]